MYQCTEFRKDVKISLYIPGIMMFRIRIGEVIFHTYYMKEGVE